MEEQKKYDQKPNIKISAKFKDVLMKLKLDFSFKDLEALIKEMYDIILKHKLTEELKNHKEGSI